jgi:hypothetical protein
MAVEMNAGTLISIANKFISVQADPLYLSEYISTCLFSLSESISADRLSLLTIGHVTYVNRKDTEQITARLYL